MGKFTFYTLVIGHTHAHTGLGRALVGEVAE